MSLADRKKQAEQEEETKNKIPNGDYVIRLKDWKFGKSKNGKEMYTLTWKILEAAKAPKGGDKLEHKGKERRTFYVISQSWALVQLLDILEQTGADLEAVEDESGIDNILEAIEDSKMPKALMNVEHQEGKQFPKITITQVECVLGKAETPAPGKSKGKPAGKPEPEEDKVETPEDDD